MSFPVTVKWGKETLEFPYDPATGVKGLKAELQEKTHVPLDRMKIMAKSKGLWKGILKDDEKMEAIDWDGIHKKSKIQMLLMGSAAKLEGPSTKTVFLEDLPPEEIAKVQEPSGLVNLGNTCYLNSVIQCLRVVTPLRAGLTQSAPAAQSGASLLLGSLRDTYQRLDRQTEALHPTALVQATKLNFPQFAQTGPRGEPMQQDAEEFYSGLMTLLATETEGTDAIRRALTVDDPQDLLGAENLIDALFGIRMQETFTCDESSQETPTVTFDLHRKLVCNIQGGSDASAQTNVSHIYEGIQLSLDGKIEKNADSLGRDAVWTRSQRMARLPPYLAVQFGRFFWKATPDSADHAGVKCKVMKPVAFTGRLDVYDFCTQEIQDVLRAARKKALRAEEDAVNRKLAGEDAMEEDEDLTRALAMSVEADEPKIPIGPGLPEDFQGHYELFAVVTHKGRNADGGHYMAWVKSDHKSANVEKIADTDEDNEDWFVFDDDEVSPCKTEDVLKLKGGGDWHMSYLNFYRAKK